MTQTTRGAAAIASSAMGARAEKWDIPNVWICDGSLFPTVGGVNPSLAIRAVAYRTADRIKTLAAARGEL
ncbi:choline dehydrogenase-like flavoprotein [Paraburkholderia silvatlantica]|uniref:Choline dehydrogenase-like flavoprotein n=1 Tax=Paraburkholderia silvatlantica TaxID=321895 RepID=A0ABR6FJJ1_9BURK|nr:GMC oxidoreductase [Paraburkholderia silvatlantica]MBB2927601.1 choline dehydrogenase-like flavoprotein [Paraburkholderia silvatlantica]PVY36311.1 GMC oxidoreductase [Paraburkholderia silvatlantica]PXW40272.1 GMC oxidoreductase [Paraburkholderia silvatlantica]